MGQSHFVSIHSNSTQIYQIQIKEFQFQYVFIISTRGHYTVIVSFLADFVASHQFLAAAEIWNH